MVANEFRTVRNGEPPFAQSSPNDINHSTGAGLQDILLLSMINVYRGYRHLFRIITIVRRHLHVLYKTTHSAPLKCFTVIRFIPSTAGLGRVRSDTEIFIEVFMILEQKIHISYGTKATDAPDVFSWWQTYCESSHHLDAFVTNMCAMCWGFMRELAGEKLRQSKANPRLPNTCQYNVGTGFVPTLYWHVFGSHQ